MLDILGTLMIIIGFVVMILWAVIQLYFNAGLFVALGMGLFLFGLLIFLFPEFLN